MVVVSLKNPQIYLCGNVKNMQIFSGVKHSTGRELRKKDSSFLASTSQTCSLQGLQWYFINIEVF